MDVIFIRELQISTIIGIYDWEQQIRQTLLLDLELATDIRRAAASDNIADTLDYKAVSRRLIEFAESRSFGLVETLAEACCALILNEFKVTWVRLRVNKRGALSRAADVGVLIERRRNEPHD